VELTHHLIDHRKIIADAHNKAMNVAMDATKVAWALSNLLTNALRHTPRGGKVDVFLEAFDDRTMVRVKDTGPGIERSRQEKIFEKFNPYYDLRVARSGTVGAGLAIAKEIVVAHGGRIWVDSESGQGAEFCFVLPEKRLNQGLTKVTEQINEKNKFSL
jgi:two-component system sensor histidine kinase VicK